MRLRAYYDQLRGTVSLIIFRQVGSQEQYLKMPKNFEWKDCHESQAPNDDAELIIPSELFQGDFFDSFFSEIELCMKSAGFYTKKQKENLKKLEGLESKLEAREYHLEDMRKLVFETKEEKK